MNVKADAPDLVKLLELARESGFSPELVEKMRAEATAGLRAQAEEVQRQLALLGEASSEPAAVVTAKIVEPKTEARVGGSSQPRGAEHTKPRTKETVREEQVDFNSMSGTKLARHYFERHPGAKAAAFKKFLAENRSDMAESTADSAIYAEMQAGRLERRGTKMKYRYFLKGSA